MIENAFEKSLNNERNDERNLIPPIEIRSLQEQGVKGSIEETQVLQKIWARKNAEKSAKTPKKENKRKSTVRKRHSRRFSILVSLLCFACFLWWQPTRLMWCIPTGALATTRVVSQKEGKRCFGFCNGAFLRFWSDVGANGFVHLVSF